MEKKRTKKPAAKNWKTLFTGTLKRCEEEKLKSIKFGNISPSNIRIEKAAEPPENWPEESTPYNLQYWGEEEKVNQIEQADDSQDQDYGPSPEEIRKRDLFNLIDSSYPSIDNRLRIYPLDKQSKADLEYTGTMILDCYDLHKELLSYPHLSPGAPGRAAPKP